jgi:hypothetical protein
MKPYKKQLQKLIKLWSFVEIFFSSGANLYALGLMRFLVSSALFGLYLWRHLEVKFYFTDQDSIVLRGQALDLIPQFYRTPFPFFIWPESLIPSMHLVLIICLFLLLLGLGNRLLTLFTWFLCLGFMQRNFFVAYGADLIGSLWLFYLSWTKHNVRWSILNYFKPERIKLITPDILSHAGFRMIQIQICVIYAYTGLQKLKGMSWWDGTSLWTVLGSSQMAVWDFHWVSQFPILVAVLVFCTLFFEIYFPFLVWNQKTRVFILVFGFVFHLSIAVAMGIWSFSTIMISSYLLFIPDLESKLIFLKNYSASLANSLSRTKVSGF